MTILPQLEHDLFQAAKRLRRAPDIPREPVEVDQPDTNSTTRRTRLHARFRTIATPMPLLLSVLLTLAVGAVALTALQRSHQSVPTRDASSAHSSRQHLIESLSVLRRPQAKGDLDPRLASEFSRILSTPDQLARRGMRPPAALEKRIAEWGYPELDRQLVRAINIPAWEAKVGIEPTTFRTSRSSPRRVEGLTLELWIGNSRTIPPSHEVGTGPRPTSLATLLDHGLAIADTRGGSEVNNAVVLVPDGVAAIEIGPFTPGPNASLPGVSAHTLEHVVAAIHANGRVHDNIAALQIAIPIVTSRHLPPGPRGNSPPSLFGIATTAQDTWFDASGHVMRRTTTALDLIVRVQVKRSR